MRPGFSARISLFIIPILLSLFLRCAESEDRAVFSNSFKPLPAEAIAPRAAVDQAAALDFMIALNMRDFDGLQARIGRGELIAPEEMAARYYPLESDYAAVTAWLTAQGFTIVNNDPARLGIFAFGTVAQIQSSFQTTFTTVSLDGETFTSATAAPSLPASIAKPVLGINGLQPHILPKKHSRQVPLGEVAGRTNNSPPFLPGEILKAYNANGLAVDGTGQKIGIIIDTFPKNTDLTSFWSSGSVPQSLNNMEFIQAVNGTLPAASGEETLDVEWSSAMASGAKIRVYATTDLSFVHLDQAYSKIIADLPSQPGLRQVSCSFGLGETFSSTSQNQTDAQFFASLAAGGVTVFVSAGDGGSSPSSSGHTHSGPVQAEVPAADPNVIAVGGTSLFLSGAGTVNSENAWFDGGGGISTQFNRPVWQLGNGIPTGTKRVVPDVACAGDPDTGCFLVLNGSASQFGGTSWSAPMWAGFCALINQARTNAGQSSLGSLGPKIYPLLGSSNFHDITTGSNGNNGVYNAGPGYDLCTGVGVPNVAALIQTLTSQTGGGQANLTFDSSVTIVAPATVTVGSAIAVSTGVKNTGTGGTGAFTVRYRLSTNSTFDNSDTFLGDATISGGLAAGGKATATFSGICPNVTPGNYFLVWSIDALGEVAESNEGDNLFFAVTQIAVMASPGTPNLALDFTPGISASPLTVAVGANLSVSCSVLNSGNASASGFSVRYRLSTDTTYDPSGDDLLGDVAIVGLSGGASTPANFTGPCPNVAPGDYFLILRIDAFGEVAESDEDDNVYYRVGQITVTAATGIPNLTLDPNAAIITPATVAAGSPMTVTTGVFNNGAGDAGSFVVRYRLSTDINYDATDSFVGDSLIMGLAAGGKTSAPFTGNCPNVTPGDYWLVWFIDVLDAVAESSETDNKFFAQTKITITQPNNPPTIDSGPTYAPQPALVNQDVTFGVSASDIDGDTLTISWDFGDSTNGTGNAPTHKYIAPGIYTAQVTVTDGRGGSAQASVDVTVTLPFIATNLKAKKFALAFRTGNDSVDITFDNADFAALANGASLSFSIGDQLIDTGTLLKNKAKGNVNFGKFTLTPKKMTLRYTLTRTFLQDLFAIYGAQNQTIIKGVNVPLYIGANNQLYGGTYSFTYKAKVNATGKGS